MSPFSRSSHTMQAWLTLYLFAAATTATAQEPATFKARPPELEQRSQADWINSRPLKLSELRGQVVVLHFWTFGCINCQHNYPTLKAWQKAFAKKGVTIIGVHTPEMPVERDIQNIRKSAEKNGLAYPIVADLDAKIWKAWGNQMWPSTYLIDKNGFARYRWDGEFSWKKARGAAAMRKKIEQLLAEPAAAEVGSSQQ
jgi:peroxiredoxin